jgi:hypothetical protein
LSLWFRESSKNCIQYTKQFAEGLKTGAKFEAYMAGANALNGREVDAKRSIMAIAEFGILGAGLGQIGFKSPTQLQKSAGLEFGKNPEGFKAIAEAMRKDGQLDEAQYNQRIELIDRYKEAYKTLPKADAKGNELTPKQKEDYLYNAVIKNEGNRGKSNLPPKQAEKAEMTAMVADHKNDLILEPKTDKQLQSRKEQLEKQLEKKDEEGKLELTDKERKNAEAELEAINQTIKEREDTTKSEEKLPKLSEPIEGVDEFGVPIGENVPPEVKGEPAPVSGVEGGDVESNQHTAGYSTIALDYLFTGGRDVIQSTDYLLQALVGGFEHSAKEIDAIRNKYADKLGNIKDDINSEVYKSMMQEIKDVINKKYNDVKAGEIFDKILNNATGFTNREGNQVSIELEKLNEDQSLSPTKEQSGGGEQSTKVEEQTKPIELSVEPKPTPSKAAGQPTVDNTLTQEAKDLLKSIGEGSKPTFITKNLERIAKENGIEVTDKMSADDVINALKEKQSKPIELSTEQTGKGEDWSRDVESTAKALEGLDVSELDKKISNKVFHGTSYDI